MWSGTLCSDTRNWKAWAVSFRGVLECLVRIRQQLLQKMASSTIKPAAIHISASRWRWAWGTAYIIAVALIWIAASFVVQSVVDSGVSPFLVTYICNSLFIVYIPIVEMRRYLERTVKDWAVSKEYGLGRTGYGKPQEGEIVPDLSRALDTTEREILLEEVQSSPGSPALPIPEQKEIFVSQEAQDREGPDFEGHLEEGLLGNGDELVDESAVSDDRPWTRKRTALVGLTICPFWFLAQLTFNFSLKYTTVTSNTILSTSSSLFTFLVSLQFLGERFTWLKLASVALCMSGTILVSLGDSWKEADQIATNPLLGDVICLSSAAFYATYTALLRVKIPNEEDEKGKVSTALVFGYLGLFNALLLAPVALLLHFTGVESFHRLTLSQVGLIVGKGLFDNVFSDYLWARAVLLTTPTAATAGLTIQVPIAAALDSLRGVVPSYMDVFGGFAVLIGFFGINHPDPPHPIPHLEEKAEKVVGAVFLTDDPLIVSPSDGS